MTIALDSQSSGAGSSNPVTIAHTCSASTKLLLVFVYDYAVRSGGVPSYNSDPMTDSGEGPVSDFFKQYLEVFYLEAPSTGSSYDVSIPNGNLDLLYIQVASFEADGSLVYHNSNSVEADTANPSVTVATTVSNGLAIGGMTHDLQNQSTISVGTGYTSLFAADRGGDQANGEYNLDFGTGNPITVNYTAAADDHGLIGVLFEESSAGPINESVSLLNKKGVSGANNVSVFDTSSFVKFNGVIPTTLANVQELITQNKKIYTTSESIINRFESVDLNRIDYVTTVEEKVIDETVGLLKVLGIIPSSTVQVYDNTNLNKIKSIISFSQANVNDSALLHRINTIPTTELGTIFDSVGLGIIDYLTVLEETQGQINETIILNRVMGFNASSQISVYDSVTLNRINYIPTTSLGNLQNLVTLNRIDGLTVIEEIQGAIYETIVLNKILGLTPSSQVNVYDSVAINVIRGLNSSSQMSYDESVIMNIVRGLTTSELLKVSEIVSINAFYGLTTPELLEISEFIQLSREEELILSNNVVIFDSISLPIWRILTIKPTGKFVITNVKADNAFFVIFRDKRYPIIFRDKRFGAIFRDKSTKGGS